MTVRRNAAAAGLDAVLVPLCVSGWNLRQSLETARGADADGRYLTMLDNAALVLPSDGRAPTVSTERGSSNSWIVEAVSVHRDHAGSWGAAMVDAIAALNLASSRIGVAGLVGGRVTHVRAADGVVNYSAFVNVIHAFPNAQFEDASDVVGYARYVKSDEEIACLQRGSEMLESAIEVMIECARPGVELSEIYARSTRRLLELGGQYQALAIIFGPAGGGLPMRFHDPVLGQRIEDGYLVDNEMHVIWGGLISQEVQPFVLGPTPAGFDEVIPAHRELFDGGLELMRPGVQFGELIDYTRSFAQDRGMESEIIMHGRGHGNDGPLLTPADGGERIRTVSFEAGNVFVWKPQLFARDKSVNLIWGGNVQCTPTGGVRMGRREHGLVSIAAGARSSL